MKISGKIVTGVDKPSCNSPKWKNHHELTKNQHLTKC